MYTIFITTFYTTTFSAIKLFKFKFGVFFSALIYRPFSEYYSSETSIDYEYFMILKCTPQCTPIVYTLSKLRIFRQVLVRCRCTTNRTNVHHHHHHHHDHCCREKLNENEKYCCSTGEGVGTAIKIFLKKNFYNKTKYRFVSTIA